MVEGRATGACCLAVAATVGRQHTACPPAAGLHRCTALHADACIHSTASGEVIRLQVCLSERLLKACCKCATHLRKRVHLSGRVAAQCDQLVGKEGSRLVPAGTAAR